MSRAKCNAPIIAISDLADVALKDRDKEMQLKAIEAIREIGMPKEGPYPVGAAMAALVQTVLQTADPDLGAAAEDALLKLLPLIGRRLMMDDAILLLEAHESGNPRVAGAVEGAWSACALTKEKVANEPEKRRIQQFRDAAYWAKEDEKRRLAGLPSRAELMAGARARREQMFRGPEQPSPFGPPVAWKETEAPSGPTRRNRERPDGMGTAAGGQDR